MTHRIFVTPLLLLAIIFATSNTVLAEDEAVKLNVPHSMNMLIDLGYFKKELKTKNKEVIVLSDIIGQQKGTIDNLFQQNKICSNNYNIKETQAEEWKAAYAEVNEELIKALDIPWYRFDIKSMASGSIITLILVILL